MKANTTNQLPPISQFGETALLERIRKNLSGPTAEYPGGMNDDAAVIPLDRTGKRFRLATCDMLVEGTHFRSDWISAVDLGEKALAVNVSDIAAMGGVPDGYLLGLGVRSDEPVRWIDELYRGLRNAQRKYGVALLGGDTVHSPVRTLAVTLLGSFTGARRQLPLRSNMRPDDYIYLAGFVGDAAAGLELLLKPALRKKIPGKTAQRLVRAQLCPKALLHAGQTLTRSFPRLALIDLSDDLCFSLERLAEASGAGYVVELEYLPLSKELRNFCVQLGRDACLFAAGGGEDYGLLFACAAGPEELQQKLGMQLGRLPLHCIGRAVRGASRILLRGDALAPDAIKQFRHF